MTAVVSAYSLTVESPFRSFSVEFFLVFGTAFAIAGGCLWMAAQMRVAMALMDPVDDTERIPGSSQRAAIVLAASMGIMTWYMLTENPAMLKSVRTIIAVTAVLVPAAATVIAIRGLLGEA